MWFNGSTIKDLLNDLGVEFGVLAGFCLLYWSVCWRADGRRWIWLLFRWPKIPGWQPLDTPRRCIYHVPDDVEGLAKNRRVKHLFWKVSKDKHVRGIIEGMMAPADTRFEKRMDRFWCQVKTAKYYTIYRRLTCLAGGWAQTKEANTSRCVLGLEPEFIALHDFVHELFLQATGHELAHIAQEARDQSLRMEWERHRGAFLLILWTEAEAHSLFPLWPMLFAGLVGGGLFAYRPQAMTYFLFHYYWIPGIFVVAALGFYAYFRRHTLFYK